METFLAIFIVTVLAPRLAFADGIQYSLPNFLQVNSIEELLLAILNVLIVIATPIIILFIIYGGFLYVTAQGNPEQIKTATRTLTYAIIGGILIIGATAAAAIIKNMIAAF
jgi:hypothetical protein